jgi:hypothetical protein
LLSQDEGVRQVIDEINAIYREIEDILQAQVGCSLKEEDCTFIA